MDHIGHEVMEAVLRNKDQRSNPCLYQCYVLEEDTLSAILQSSQKTNEHREGAPL